MLKGSKKKKNVKKEATGKCFSKIFWLCSNKDDVDFFTKYLNIFR